MGIPTKRPRDEASEPKQDKPEAEADAEGDREEDGEPIAVSLTGSYADGFYADDDGEDDDEVS